MALPAGITTATVTVGVPVTFTGAAVKTFVSIEPSAYLVHAATGTPLVDFLEEMNIAEGVAGQYTLPHTDQAGFIDDSGNAYTNWYYTARVTYSTPSKAKNKAPKVKVFQLTTGQTDVDLDLLPAGAPALPYIAPSANVSSFAGRTGPVTLQESDLPARLADAALDATYATPATVTAAVSPKLDSATAATTYAAKSLETKVPNAPVSTSVGVYNRLLNVYNFKPAQVFRLRAALAKAAAGTALANIGFNGDSTVAGTNGGNVPGTTAWPVLFRNMLTNLGYPSAGTGIVAAYRAASASDPRWTYGAGWSAPSGNSNRIANSTTTNALAFASVETGTQTHVYYSNTSGPFTVALDGGAPVAVTPTGASTMGVLTSGTLADTTHTISIVRTSGTVEIFGVELRKAQTGVRVYNAGIAGAKAASVADANWNAVAQTVAGGAGAQFTADAIFLCCEINDMTGGGGSVVPAATYKTQMQTAITNLKVNGASVVLITANPVSSGDFTDYNKALYELADTNDLPLIDMQDRWGTYAAANSRAIMGDTVHPSPAGNAEIARAVLNAIGL